MQAFDPDEFLKSIKEKRTDRFIRFIEENPNLIDMYVKNEVYKDDEMILQQYKSLLDYIVDCDFTSGMSYLLQNYRIDINSPQYAAEDSEGFDMDMDSVV